MARVSMATQVRLQKVDERLNKKTYPKHWGADFKRMIRVAEQMEMQSKFTSHLWHRLHKKGFVAAVDNANPLFFADFDAIAVSQKQYDRLSKSLTRLETKTGVGIDQVQKEYSLHNRKHCTSF